MQVIGYGVLFRDSMNPKKQEEMPSCIHTYAIFPSQNKLLLENLRPGGSCTDTFRLLYVNIWHSEGGILSATHMQGGVISSIWRADNRSYFILATSLASD